MLLLCVRVCTGRAGSSGSRRLWRTRRASPWPLFRMLGTRSLKLLCFLLHLRIADVPVLCCGCSVQIVCLRAGAVAVNSGISFHEQGKRLCRVCTFHAARSMAFSRSVHKWGLVDDTVGGVSRVVVPHVSKGCDLVLQFIPSFVRTQSLDNNHNHFDSTTHNRVRIGDAGCRHQKSTAARCAGEMQQEQKRGWEQH